MESTNPHLHKALTLCAIENSHSLILNISNNDILQFWEWFLENSRKLEVEHLDKAVMFELDTKILAWKLTWEIGPGLATPNSLCISPNGDVTLLGDTEEIVSNAPTLYNWEFYHYKQPKDTWNKFYLHDKALTVDATHWTYVLLEYPDNKLECIVKAKNMKELDESTKRLAADLVLTNLLGEKSNMMDISFVDIVSEFEDPLHVEKAGNLGNLLPHLRGLSGGA